MADNLSNWIAFIFSNMGLKEITDQLQFVTRNLSTGITQF
jgi:hypothetical protein